MEARMNTALLLTALLGATNASPGNDSTQAQRMDLGKVGSVALPNSCRPEVQEDFGRGVALLHSFFYEEARTVFQQVAERDPKCAMAFWGTSMTYYHPLWAPPLAADVALGTEAANRAAALPVHTDIEKGLIAAANAYWRGGSPPASDQAPPEGVPSCHGGSPSPGGKAEAFRTVLEGLHERFSDDVEVTTFYALALLGTAPKEDRTLSQQKKAAGLLEAMWTRHPNHPGVVHYLIHAYDYPETAQLGLPAAHAYAGVAPQVPHALHMPSHIFVRLGLWPDDETSNLASIAAAERWSSVRHPGTTFSDALHAMDYLEYGYLQQGRYAEAEMQNRRMIAVGTVHPPNEMGAAFARAIVPARFVLERESWDEAARLEVQPIAAWDDYPFVRGLVEYARLIGAARFGDAKRARTALANLEGIERGIPAGALGYFVKLMEAYRLAGLGWVSHLEKKDAEAIELIKRAADLEDSIGPNPISPGPLLPARELLGDLLFDLNRGVEALAAYKATLAVYPGRLRSMAGAMRAAKKAGDVKAAQGYAHQLLQMTQSGGGQFVAEARVLIR